MIRRLLCHFPGHINPTAESVAALWREKPYARPKCERCKGRLARG